jgi:L-threonylcarbamoyladenylate synthase
MQTDKSIDPYTPKDIDLHSVLIQNLPYFTERLSSNELQRAAQLIKEGELVAFPTETVYGLGAAIFNPSAIESIFNVKKRPMDNPLIAHIGSIEQVNEIAIEIPDSFYLLAKSFFPGPLTVVLKRNEKVAPIISAGLHSIALRMPSHPIALELISLVGEPLVAPSANLSGKPSSTQESHVLEDFEGKIAAVIKGGKTDLGIESTVISLLGETPTLLRPGAITKEQVEHVLKRSIEVPSNHRGPILSPGMKYRHYSPHAMVKLFQTFEALKNYLMDCPSSSPRMALSLRKFPTPLQGVDSYLLSAKEFYSLLRFADQKKYQEILILCDKELQTQTALMNRLLRSAGEVLPSD